MLIHKGHGTRIEARREIQTEKEKKKIIHKSPETRIEIRRGTGKEERIKRKIGEKMREKQEKKGRKTEERRSTEPGKAQDDIEATTTDAPILTMTFPIMMTTNTTITSPGSDTPGMIWMSSIEGRGLLTAIIGVEDHLLIDSMIVEDPRLDTELPIIDGLVTMIITIEDDRGRRYDDRNDRGRDGNRYVRANEVARFQGTYNDLRHAYRRKKEEETMHRQDPYRYPSATRRYRACSRSKNSATN